MLLFFFALVQGVIKMMGLFLLAGHKGNKSPHSVLQANFLPGFAATSNL